MRDNDFHKSILENSPVGYTYSRIIYDKNGNPQDYEILEVNKAYKDMVGIGKKDLIGKTIGQVYEATNMTNISWSDYHHIASNYEMEEFEYYFDFRDKYYRVKTFSPEEGYIAMYLTDISREMSQTEKVNIISDNVTSQVWYLDDPSSYVSANRAHADFLGLKKEDLESKNIREIFKEEEAEACFQGNQRVFKEKKEILTKEWLSNARGEKRLLKIRKNPKLDSQGQVEYVICSGEDVTDEYISKEQGKIKERILYSTMEFTQELLTNENISKALSNGLAMLGNASQVDRVYYWENYFDEKSGEGFTSQKNEWCLGGIEEQIDNPELQNIPFKEAGEFIEILSQNKTFNSHVKDMEDGAGSTKKCLQDQGILSILVIPIFVRGEFKGFIGFDSCKYEKEWSQVEISLLNSFVLLYAKILEKKLLEDKIIQQRENLFNFFNMNDDLLFVLDFKGDIVDVNNNVLKRFNYSREDLLGAPVSILHPKDKLEEVKNNIEDLIMGKVESCNIEAITKEGYIFPVETRVSQGVWNGEKVIFAVSKDISKLKMSEEKFSKAFNNSGVSMFISKFKDGEILEVNDTFLELIGLREDEIVGRSTLDLNFIKEFKNRQALKEEIRTQGRVSDREIKIIGKDKKIRTGLVNILPLNIHNEKCLISSIIDISERVEYEGKILELSNRDPLTGIYNRRCFYSRGEEIIEEYKRNKNLFSLAIIDIDNFKRINDQYGHQIGDCVLKEFTKVIKDNLRIYDILGRYGGEEFIIILNHSDREEGKMVLERILSIVRKKTFIFHEKKIGLTFSAGISFCQEFEKDVISIDKLVGLADERMYRAKNSGRNGIVCSKNVLAN